MDKNVLDLNSEFDVSSFDQIVNNFYNGTGELVSLVFILANKFWENAFFL